eukprot:1144524-Karenia_brevis.AAC.1
MVAGCYAMMAGFSALPWWMDAFYAEPMLHRAIVAWHPATIAWQSIPSHAAIIAQHPALIA